MKNKKIIIFDLDGVLFDSKKNMSISWKKVQNIHNLNNVLFEEYFKHIGKPFNEILKLIGIKKNHEKISQTYQNESSKHKSTIKYFNKTIQTLSYLKKKNYVLNIVTSKDFKRTKKFLGKKIYLFKYIECHSFKKKGKPNPQMILNIIKKNNARKSECIYIGDTQVDYQTAKNANIDFMFALWGYGKNYNYKYKCETIADLPKKLIN